MIVGGGREEEIDRIPSRIVSERQRFQRFAVLLKVVCGDLHCCQGGDLTPWAGDWGAVFECYPHGLAGAEIGGG